MCGNRPYPYLNTFIGERKVAGGRQPPCPQILREENLTMGTLQVHLNKRAKCDSLSLLAMNLKPLYVLKRHSSVRIGGQRDCQ